MDSPIHFSAQAVSYTHLDVYKRQATKNDLLIVYVRMLDKQGVLCPVNGIPVELSVQGGEIVGPTSVSYTHQMCIRDSLMPMLRYDKNPVDAKL